MPPLYVTFLGKKGDIRMLGWDVIERDPIKTEADMEALFIDLSEKHGYEQLVVCSFQRLES